MRRFFAPSSVAGFLRIANGEKVDECVVTRGQRGMSKGKFFQERGKQVRIDALVAKLFGNLPRAIDICARYGKKCGNAYCANPDHMLYLRKRAIQHSPQSTDSLEAFHDLFGDMAGIQALQELTIPAHRTEANSRMRQGASISLCLSRHQSLP